MTGVGADTLDGVTNRPFAEAATGAGRTVGAVAALVGVTVRTLHHWDAIGLVCPSERSYAGYRLYTAEDIARIHRVLVYRELGVPLNEVGALLDAPATDAAAALRKQRNQVRERVARLQQMGDALDRLIEARESGILLPAEEQVAIFGQHWQPAWAGEAREQWGDTAQWAQFAERAADRTAEQWQQIAESVEALNADLAAAYRAGTAPGSDLANALAERHRASIGVYFDCTHSMQVCLGRRHTADPGFTAFYDAIEPGLTVWLRDIIDANARANGIDPETATWT